MAEVLQTTDSAIAIPSLPAFLTYAPIAVAVLDQHLNYLCTSHQWRASGGWDEADLLGQSHLEAVSHGSDEWRLFYQQSLTEGIVAQREEFTQISPTATGWLNWRVSPWRDATGNPGGLIVLREDITAQKLAVLESHSRAQDDRALIEAALTESEEKFRRLVESANDLTYMIGLDGNFTYLSPQFQEMWGYELPDFEGKSFAEIVHPEDMVKVTRSAQWVMQTRQRDSGLEFCTQRKDGSWCWIVCNSSPIVDAQGNVVGLQGIARDVSDRKQAELQLQQSEAKFRQQAEELTTALQKLQTTQLQLIQSEKMSSLGQLVAGVAHEINNPVNFIYGNVIHAGEYVQDLLKLLKLYYEHYPNPGTAIQTAIEEIDLDFLMQDLPKVLSSMKVGADRIRQIVLSLRTFSRMDEAELKQVDIHDGINSTLIILEHRLKAKDDHPAIQVIKNYSPLPLVECFAGELNQVFMNILTNAIDALNEVRFTAPSNFMPTITLTTQQTESNQITIQIADNGPGIPESVKTRLFDPFFTTKPVGKGTGIGLSISYQIITERHGGSLRCNSAPGQGAEFVISIPIKQATQDML
ncbi:MAG: hypothetical protein OHK0047_35310 [Leptolyngbyaceae cyanobacterium]